MDFTLTQFIRLLDALKAYGYESLTLRHVVDLKPANSLRTARIEAELGLFGIYYFRAVPESWDETIIRQIAALKVLGYVNIFNRGIARVQKELVENGNGKAIFTVDRVTVFSVNVTNSKANSVSGEVSKS